MNLALISNMYPSTKFPVFGIFVRNTEALLVQNKVSIVQKAVRQQQVGKFAKLYSYLKLYIQILFIFLSKKADKIYIHFPLQTAPILNFCSRFSTKKIILNIHGSELNEKSRFHNSLVKLFSKADLIVVPSQTYACLLQENYKIHGTKIFVSPSGGVDASKFKSIVAEDLKMKYKLMPEHTVLAFISSFIKEKGFATYLEAAKNLLKDNKNLRFLMLGSGPAEAEIKHFIKHNNLTEHFILVPRQAQADLPKFFSLADVFIFPSHRESLGLVALEALSCGTPVIASNIDTMKEYIKEGKNGFLFLTQNAADLEAKIRIYLQHENKAVLEKNALESVKQYQSLAVGKALAERFKQV